MLILSSYGDDIVVPLPPNYEYASPGINRLLTDMAQSLHGSAKAGQDAPAHKHTCVFGAISIATCRPWGFEVQPRTHWSLGPVGLRFFLGSGHVIDPRRLVPLEGRCRL